jgi:tripartite-type tricarboxylate transporter receptor subunit TctC
MLQRNVIMRYFGTSLHALATVCALVLTGFTPAGAADWPTRSIRWIVSFPAGGATDMTARIMGQWLSERLGQPVVIENRGGGGNNIGTEMAANAPADGYTLFLANPANSINATLYRKLNFNFIRDMTAVACIIRVPNVMTVNPKVPAKNTAEFIAWAKKNPGKINMASSGNGTSTHLAGELFKKMAGVDIQHVPYRGSAPALTDLIAGQVQVSFDGLPASMEHIRAGTLRAMGVTTATRVEMLPDVPTVGETVPGYEANGYYGIAAPKGTPKAIIDRLNAAVKAGLNDPKIRARYIDLGGIPHVTTPEEYARIIKDETIKWSEVIKLANVPLVD